MLGIGLSLISILDLQPLIKSVLGKTPLLSDVSTFATYPDHDLPPVAAMNDLPPVSQMQGIYIYCKIMIFQCYFEALWLGGKGLFD